MNNRGYHVFGTMVAIFILALIGGVVLYTAIVSEIAKKMSGSKAQAFYTAQAGAEYAMKKFYQPASPVVSEPGKGFTNGTFVISYADPTVTVTGRWGDTNHTSQFNRPSDAKCTSIDAASAVLDGASKIHHIYFEKDCLTQVIIDKMTLSWSPDGGERIEKIRIDNSYVLYDNTGGQGSGELLELNNYTVTDSAPHDFSKIEFRMSDNLAGKTFTLTITFNDGSQSTPLVFAPP